MDKQREILKLYEKIEWKRRNLIWKSIGKKCNRNFKSVRNWFCSWKKFPIKFESLIIKTLKDEIDSRSKNKNNE